MPNYDLKSEERIVRYLATVLDIMCRNNGRVSINDFKLFVRENLNVGENKAEEYVEKVKAMPMFDNNGIYFYR